MIWYFRSAAYKSLTYTLPRTTQLVIDNLIHDESELCKSSLCLETKDDLSNIIYELTKLKFEIENDVPLEFLKGEKNDIRQFNCYMTAQQKLEPRLCYKKSLWLLTESYVYRRLRNIFEQSKTLQDYDPFGLIKQKGFYAMLDLAVLLSEYLEFVTESDVSSINEFRDVLKTCLWSNRVELISTLSEEEEYDVVEVKTLDNYILDDDTLRIWSKLHLECEYSTIDIVPDNAGYELFSDLCLADYLITKQLARNVRFHVKQTSTSISSVVLTDFQWLLKFLISDPVFHDLGLRWRHYLHTGQWEVIVDNFWSLPLDFSWMEKVRVGLYDKLSEACMIIFKGDLNYRKLVGDFNWPEETPLAKAATGFHPASICILRTIKSEVLCGVKKKFYYQDENAGEYAVIQSFAYHTVKNRMPIILTQTIDRLVREKEEIGKVYGEEGQEDLKEVIGELSKLKYEIQTNKPITPLQSTAADAATYNDYLSDLERMRCGHVTFFNAIWLHSECYMYRRIRQIFELTKSLKNYDPFRSQKQSAYEQALPLIEPMAAYLTKLTNTEGDAKKEEFVSLLKYNLWGNRCDLSLSNGAVDSNDTLFDIDVFEPKILSDQSNEIWDAISDPSSESSIIDFIFDNAGYELFTDFCVADYILSKNLAKKIRFYVKAIPWFISDVMEHDYYWILDKLTNSSNETLQKLGQKWKSYVDNKSWELIVDDFWTLPVDYSQMAKYSPNLYKRLQQAKLAIFKGDLNYRKLFGEKNWEYTTPVDEALRGFHPTKLCSLRTVKADIVCGLAPGVGEKTDQIDKKWKETGEYGLIQFSGKICHIK